MSITRYDPNTIHLAGPATEINDLSASEAITPGMLVEMFTSATVTRFRKSTLTDKQNSTFAVQRAYANDGVDSAYALADLVDAKIGAPGCVIWGLVASGANLAKGALLTDAGNGYFKAVGSGVAIARALETVDNSAGPSTARIRVEFV